MSTHAKRLVILGSSETALALARDTYDHGFEPVVFDTRAGIAFRSRRVRTEPLLGISEEERDARVIALGDPATPVIASDDGWLRIVMGLRPKLEAAYAKVLVCSNRALEICLDKTSFARWCRASGVPAPIAWLVGDEPRPADLRLPMILRPRETQHWVASDIPKAVEVRTEGELTEWLRRYEAAGRVPLVTHSLLPRPLIQYSVPFVRSERGALSFVATKVRPVARKCGVGTFMAMSPNPAIRAVVDDAIERLDYYGMGEAEVLHDTASGESFLIEINARPWLQYALAPSTGHDFLGLLLGVPLPNLPPRSEAEGSWWNLVPDVYQSIKGDGASVRSLADAARSFASAAVSTRAHCKFKMDDPVPALPDAKTLLGWARAVPRVLGGG